MSMHIGLEDNGVQIVVRVSGGYNPDIFDDMTTRAATLYKVAFEERLREEVEAE